MRRDDRRVSAVPKVRRCGVPCLLLVASWTLFLLLLLTSSMSHDDDEDAAGVLEELDDLTGASLAGGRGNHPDGNGEGSIGFVGSNLDEKSVPSESDGDLHHSHSINSRDKFELEHSSSSGGVLPTRIIFHELAEPIIDALQYTEYGAGLLQKSVPAEGKSRICLLRNAGGTHCRVVSHHRELSGQNCIWLTQGFAEGKDQAFPNDCPADERCHDALSYESDLVAEIEPGGGSCLVCQTDSHFEKMAVCGVASSTQSECLLPRVELNSIPSHASSSNDLPLRPGDTHQEGHGQLGAPERKAEELLSSEHPNPVESEGQQPARRIIVHQQDEELSSPVNIDSDSNDSSQQAVDELEHKTEDKNADEMPPQTVNVEDAVDESKVVVDASGELMDANVAFVSPLVKSDATGGESLVYPADDGFLEERDFDDELLVPLLVEPELLLEEPRRLQRVGSVMSLDEYKRSILESQHKSGNQVNLSSVQAQKVRHSDESYNYASASHGAKVLASNKEAKGASHILTSDKDKYLRNPCGAEDKYVVLELSEETFVDTIFISNFEFHSSNLKDFEVLGSTVYPTKDWISLGKFQAENVRHRHKFTIEDPKMVRHLMIKMLTHWGSEFFCTLSIIEVFGVDVIKNLLDDWIALEEVDNNARAQGINGPAVSPEESASPDGTGHPLDSDASLDAPFTEALITQSQMVTGSDQRAIVGGQDPMKAADGGDGDEDSKAGSTGDSSAQDLIHTLGGKPPGDSVLKILMQRVKALELNQTLFDLYLGDMNKKYKVMLSELDKDLALVTERLRNETALTASLAMRLADRELQRVEEKQYLEHRFAQIAGNFTDNLDMMRWQIQTMERREITAILLSFLCMILSGLLHLLASCLPRRNPLREISAEPKSKDVKKEVVDSTLGGMDSKLDNLSLSKVCQCSSRFILYLACALTILVLSV